MEWTHMKADVIPPLGHHLFIARIMDWLGLVKFRVSLMNAVSGAAGYVIFRPRLGWDLVVTVAGVFVLACGSAALNNYQDRELDGLFSRTRGRPLPKHLISARRVRMISMILIISGLSGLFIIRPMGLPVLLGGLAVMLYNGIYTPLKRKSVLAIIPGAICGMLPPLIGWVSAGGSICASQIIVLMAVLGLWQLPHFWLILLSDHEEYRGSDLRNMLGVFSIAQMNRILFAWVLSFSCVGMMLPMVHVIMNTWLTGGLVVCLMVLVLLFAHGLFFRHKVSGYPFLFKSLNISMGCVLWVAIADRLIPGI
jgi:protoheme IX farnesyltransferase